MPRLSQTEPERSCEQSGIGRVEARSWRTQITAKRWNIVARGKRASAATPGTKDNIVLPHGRALTRAWLSVERKARSTGSATLMRGESMTCRYALINLAVYDHDGRSPCRGRRVQPPASRETCRASECQSHLGKGPLAPLAEIFIVRLRGDARMMPSITWYGHECCFCGLANSDRNPRAFHRHSDRTGLLHLGASRLWSVSRVLTSAPSILR